jgi:hypothetical protein
VTTNVDVLTTVPNWPRRIIRIGLIYAGLLLFLMLFGEDSTPEDKTVAIATTCSGLYTLLLGRTRRWWLPRLSRRPLRNAMILGCINAAVIETLFLVIEKLMGAEGVAASPNLLLDLLGTMPWYVGMVVIFVRVQNRRRFSPWIVLLLGGIYEIGGDGLLGGTLSGDLFNPLAPLMLVGVMMWLFIPIYSSMVMPPSWLIETAPPPDPPLAPAWRDALRPLLWLFPTLIYILVWMVVLVVFSNIG